MEIRDKKQTQRTGEPKDKKIVNCFYSYFKNSPKKLKIICDWDEVIQPHEPYALWLTPLSKKQREQEYIEKKIEFSEYFKVFWSEKEVSQINYSPYGSRLVIEEDAEKLNQQQAIKNSSNFYQQAPFLTIAKELLMLIKAGIVEKLIFLSAYDKRKFPQEDPRKHEIFKQTFGKFPNCSLQLIGFDSEKQGANKVDWIRTNASNFDVVIDDNPLICKSIVENCGSKVKKTDSNIIVCTPYYPAVAKQHHLNVILIKTSVANLEKKDFK